MLNLEQVKLLESKVEKVISLVQSTLDEKASLKIQLIEKDKRITELENLLSTFRDDQSKIEAGILNTLSHLNTFERTVSEQENSSANSTANLETSPTSQVSEDIAISEYVPSENQASGTMPAADSNALNANDNNNNNDKQMDIF